MNKSLKACLMILGGGVVLGILGKFLPDEVVIIIGLGVCFIAGLAWWWFVLTDLYRRIAKIVREIVAWARNRKGKRHG